MKTIRFVDYNERIKVSNKCKTFNGQRLDDGTWEFVLEGSANDVLKGVRIAERLGYYPMYLSPVILRNGRRYELVINDDTKFWYVTRVDNRAV